MAFLDTLKQKFSETWLKLCVNLHQRLPENKPDHLYWLLGATAFGEVVNAPNYTAAVLALGKVLGDLGIEAISNVLEEFRQRKSEAERMRLLQQAATNSAAVRQVIDDLLEKMDALTLSQQAFHQNYPSPKEQLWFTETLQTAIKQAGSRLSVVANIRAGHESVTLVGEGDALSKSVKLENVQAAGNIVVNFVTPAAKHDSLLATAEKNYLDFVQREHGRIRLFGFLSHANIDVRLLDVFVSLRFSDHGREMDLKRLPEVEERESRDFTPPQVLQRAMQKKKSLLLLGGPGSGKTTLLKYFAVCCLDATSRERICLQQPLIPIFVPLRQIDPSRPFTEALSIWVKTHNQSISAKNFAGWLHQPGALVLLDGLDEVSDLRTRRQICEWIDKAASAYGESTFVVTCRFTGYREAEGVALQTPHTRADVLDLNATQQNTFLQQWFHAAGLERLEAQQAEDPLRVQEIQSEAKADAGQVVEFLAKEENRALADMASIPVLLQIMAIIWKEQGSLSGERVELYSRCIDYLLDHRDRNKKIEPLLSAAKARLVLRPLALWMQNEGRKDEAPAAEIEKQIAGKLQEVRPGTEPGEFLENIRDRAGVLVGAGAETYTFQHKSFREFLAAIEIANQNEAGILVKNFGDDWWRESILFSAGLTSPEIFPAFLEYFLKHEKNDGPTSPLLLQMLHEAAVKPLAPFEKVLRDKRLSWQKRYNALQCVRLLRRPGGPPLPEAVKELVKFVHADKEPRLRQLAEMILIEWSERPPAVIGKTPDRFFNPTEENAEYLLTRSGEYAFSFTKKKVAVPDLYFAKFPVTIKRYRMFLESLPKKLREDYRIRVDDKRFLGDDQPVMGITWYSAMAYCEWLTAQQKANGKGQKESLSFRLPTEIEWEWAATGDKREYPWGNEKPDETRANFGKKIDHTTPVGSYPAGATPEGLMDMAGNVWEWCLNGHDEPDFVLDKNPELLGDWRKIKSGNLRALRGGAYYTEASALRGSQRYGYGPVDWVDYIGFRVVARVES